MTETDASIAFWARCEACAHVSAAAYYPMDLRKFCEIASKAACPKCGGRALVAEQSAGVLLPADWEKAPTRQASSPHTAERQPNAEHSAEASASPPPAAPEAR